MVALRCRYEGQFTNATKISDELDISRPDNDRHWHNSLESIIFTNLKNTNMNTELLNQCPPGVRSHVTTVLTWLDESTNFRCFFPTWFHVHISAGVKQTNFPSGCSCVSLKQSVIRSGFASRTQKPAIFLGIFATNIEILVTTNAADHAHVIESIIESPLFSTISPTRFIAINLVSSVYLELYQMY